MIRCDYKKIDLLSKTLYNRLGSEDFAKVLASVSRSLLSIPTPVDDEDCPITDVFMERDNTLTMENRVFDPDNEIWSHYCALRAAITNFERVDSARKSFSTDGGKAAEALLEADKAPTLSPAEQQEQARREHEKLNSFQRQARAFQTLASYVVAFKSGSDEANAIADISTMTIAKLAEIERNLNIGPAPTTTEQELFRVYRNAAQLVGARIDALRQAESRARKAMAVSAAINFFLKNEAELLEAMTWITPDTSDAAAMTVKSLSKGLAEAIEEAKASFNPTEHITLEYQDRYIGNVEKAKELFNNRLSFEDFIESLKP